MAAAPPTTQELDRIRDRADRFIAELDEEYYEHFAGLKDTLDLAPIYERYEDLTTLDTANKIGAAVNGDKHLKELWRFGCENFLGALTREHSEKVAMLEATLEAEIDGTKVPFRMLRPTLGNEPDRDKRREIDRIRTTMTEEHLNPVYLDAVNVHRQGLTNLGEPGYIELYGRFGYKLHELADQCRALLESTERVYEESADRLFRDRVGVGLDEAERWDVLRVFRAPQWDPQFPKDRMLPALEATLEGLRGRFDRLADAVTKHTELDAEKKQALADAVTELCEAATLYEDDAKKLLASLHAFGQMYAKTLPDQNDAQHSARKAFDPNAEAIRGLVKQVDLLYKLAVRVAELGTELVAEDEISAAYDRRAAGRL
ncbi:MAG: hypothetical protein EHM63_07300, partial [Actinobacteria bacterium]